MRLLLVEDDETVGKYTRQGLSSAGFTVDWMRDGRGVEHALRDGAYGAVLLDLGLPGRDGMAVLARIRETGLDIPVLVLTARDAVSDRVAGLNSGADDYMIKPFDLQELVARTHALIRRRGGRRTAQHVVGDLVVDPIQKTVSLRGEPVTVSAREFAVLEALVCRPGTVLSRQALEEAVYGWQEEVASNAVEVHLHYLRRKLGPGIIENIRGVGYRVAER
jgi:DNA-binding response OmpR family regulator